MLMLQELAKKTGLVFLLTLLLLACLAYLPLTGQGLGSISVAQASGTQPLGNLNIGDRVVDPSWDWYFHDGVNNQYSGPGGVRKPVTWIVVAKDHTNYPWPKYPDNSVTLLSENLIGRHIFDNSSNRGGQYGSNNWVESGTLDATFGLRTWLNSAISDHWRGFKYAFSCSFQSGLKPTLLTYYHYSDQAIYLSEDTIFIPSTTELGDTTHQNTVMLGNAYLYFAHTNESVNAERRKAKLGGSNDVNKRYWTRSAAEYSSNINLISQMRAVNSTGNFEYLTCRDERGYVRPAVNLNSSTPVALNTTEGVYEIKGGTYNLVASFPSGTWYATDRTGNSWQWERLTGSVAQALDYGDMTGDGEFNLVASFPSGIWYIENGSWEQVTGSTAQAMAFADMTGDGRLNFVVSFPSGTWYTTTQGGIQWVRITGSVAQALTVADMTGDGQANLVASFPSGTWYITGRNGNQWQWTRITESVARSLTSVPAYRREEHYPRAFVGSFPSGTWYYLYTDHDWHWIRITGSVARANALGYLPGERGYCDFAFSFPSGTWMLGVEDWVRITGSVAQAITFADMTQ